MEIDTINSTLVVFYEGKENVFDWFSETIPPLREGQTLWLEVIYYPAWTQKGLEPIKEFKLIKFEIVKITHSLLRTFGNDILTSYKMEVELKRVK
jgi:hypothetical protein